MRDSVRLSMLPASARTVVTLYAPVAISGDTARVQLMVSGARYRRPGQPIFYTVEEYIIARNGTDWHFVRYRLLYAT